MMTFETTCVCILTPLPLGIRSAAVLRGNTFFLVALLNVPNKEHYEYNHDIVR